MIMWIDFATFVIAIATILLVTIPTPEASDEGKESREGSFWGELVFGWKYIVQRPSLIGLQLIILGYILMNSLGGAGNLVTPMILARTGGNTTVLGIAQMGFGIGGVLAGSMLGVWGGVKNRPGGLFLGILGQCLGYALIGMGRSLPVWILGAFASTFTVAIALAANQSYWQSKVPPDIQGKVFSTRRMIAQMAGPLAVLVSGPLADRVFEPAMAVGGPLAGSLGWLVGTGPGAGMGLQLFVTGVLGGLAGLAGYLFKATRDAEKLLPDHNQDAADSADLESTPDAIIGEAAPAAGK
jgi:MFS transporter, DHA3 family, macrolide efflux protein